MNGLEILILRCWWEIFTNGLRVPCISFPNNLFNIGKILPTKIYNIVFFIKKNLEKKLNKNVYISPYDLMEGLKSNNIHSLVTLLFPIFQYLWMIKC
jgi:hypothetical protein